MKLAFNATPLLSPLTGIGQYALHLALGLQQHAEIEVDFFYGTGWSRDVRTAPLPGLATAKPLLRRFLPNSYAVTRALKQLLFVQRTRRGAYDLYHEPNFLSYRFDGPCVLTVHDLSWIHYPEMHPIERVNAMNKHFPPSLEHASVILTDSVFVKNELTQMFGIAPHRIHPVLLGVEALFHPRTAQQTAHVLAQHGLAHGQYILAVGTLEPRKNLQAALRAFMTLPSQLRRHFPLVLVGLKGWHTSELEQQLAPLIRAGEIRQLGYLPREDLATIVSGATTLIYPSIYEGFGLPPLEAMACGVPVITSNVSSLPEVVGDAGLMVDPNDIEGLAHHIEMLASTPNLRQTLAQAALTRSARFSWEHCVAQTIDAYRLALSNA